MGVGTLGRRARPLLAQGASGKAAPPSAARCSCPPQRACARLRTTKGRTPTWPNTWARASSRRSGPIRPPSSRQGGKTIWLAGQTATQDEQGNDISGNFEAQVRTIFSLLDKTLKTCGGSLANMVTMTVFINDVRLRRPLRRDARGVFPGRQFSGERADHGVELRAARHADRNPGRRRHRRLTNARWRGSEFLTIAAGVEYWCRRDAHSPRAPAF